MQDIKPVILWLRRDLRLSDHPALRAACASGAPVLPVFICDDSVEGLGAAPKWRLGLSLETFAQQLQAAGSCLVLRRGNALKVLRALVAETGAGAVHWSRLYDPASIERDEAVKAALRGDGLVVQSHAGHLLFEPWTVQTGQGGFYKVYTPMWRNVKSREVAAAQAAPARIPAPQTWPGSDNLNDWQLSRAMNRGAEICRPHQRVGEVAALERLAKFSDAVIASYTEARNLPAQDGCSGLSENLTYGEISPRQCWHTGMRALHEGASGAETWLKELVWREFAYHLAFHTPHLLSKSWRDGWQNFPWTQDETRPEVMAWKQGRTGEPFVDAAMREMYVTGKIHNRARMIAASYLTKHLLTHWTVGMRWFEHCLTDWDPASNAMGWQWVAGCGPDASPYFRIFNPATQAEKFDRSGAYRRRWIAESQQNPPQTALDYFGAIPRRWRLSAGAAYPDPLVDLPAARARALEAYAARDN